MTFPGARSLVLSFKNAAITLAFLSMISFTVRGQQTAEEYRLQQEQIRRTHLMQQMDSGVYYMDIEDYITADSKFKYVLNNIGRIPSELVFYFGKNSYHLGRYKQSIDWLNKYIQLKGTNAQFSDEAVDWLKKAEAAQLKLNFENKKNAEEILSRNYDIDCGPSGKVYCPVCKGNHVIIKQGSFGNEYRTCPYCNDHGLLTCEEYNLLLRGELKPKF